MAGVQVHGVALALAVDPDGPLAGTLLLGAPGVGKSLLALEAVEACPWRRTAIVADDRVDLQSKAGRLIASAPPPLRGLVEIRGFGPAASRFLPEIALLAAFDLDGPFERVPERRVYSPPEAPSDAASLPLLPFDRGAPAALARFVATVRSILVDN